MLLPLPLVVVVVVLLLLLLLLLLFFGRGRVGTWTLDRTRRSMLISASAQNSSTH